MALAVAVLLFYSRRKDDLARVDNIASLWYRVGSLYEG